MNQTFSEEDLLPSEDERRRAREAIVDRLAATVGVLATGLVVGGMIALGACAAPAVFALTEAPSSGNAMGAAFARFDRLAIGASCVALGAEVVRTYLTRREPPRLWPRARRLMGVALAGCVSIMGIYISPTINEMHARGVRRHEGDEGAQLDAIHKKAEMLGKIETVVGIALIGLHVFTLRDRRRDDEEDDAPAPLPPGPTSSPDEPG